MRAEWGLVGQMRLFPLRPQNRRETERVLHCPNLGNNLACPAFLPLGLVRMKASMLMPSRKVGSQPLKGRLGPSAITAAPG